MIEGSKLDFLKTIAEKEGAAVITFIASDKVVRINPASYDTTSISTNDAYELEKVIDESCRGIDKAFMLLHSPGGSLTASYNIARFLQKRFKHLHIFVPYEAASGATLMSLAANKITLGDLGYLTPIDPQLSYKGGWVSSYGIVEEVDMLEKKFKNMRPEEMPIPWKQMAEKLDIVLYREMDTLVWEAQEYAVKLLKGAGYNDDVARAVAYRLARTPYSHGHCFGREECEAMKLNIDSSGKSVGYLLEMKKLISIVNEEEGLGVGHFIRAVTPGKNNQSAAGSSLAAPKEGGTQTHTRSLKRTAIARKKS
ncbi:MAG: hypothetical protein ABSE18_00925 [Minisyncoccia bacterium]|jgi:hypothetical protein